MGQKVGKTGVRPVNQWEWAQDPQQAVTSLSLREMDHLADISLFLAFVMKKATCNDSKENKTSKTTTGMEAPSGGPQGQGGENVSGPRGRTVCRL